MGKRYEKLYLNRKVSFGGMDKEGEEKFGLIQYSNHVFYFNK